jgi:plasmid stability protein
MKTLLIRDLTEETLAGLKRRAERHRRSLQKEVRLLLEEASRMQPAAEGETERLRLRRVRTGCKGTWRREEFYGDDGR